MPTRPASTIVSCLAALVVLIGLVMAGCSSGGSGSASSPSERAGQGAQATTGQVTMVVKRDAAKIARLIPSSTTAVRVTVLGTNISTTVAFPPGASEVQVVLDGVPLGTQNLLVEALSGSTVVAEGKLTVEVSANTVVQDSVVLTPVSPSPSPSPVVGDRLEFTVQPPSRVAAGFPIGDGGSGLAGVEVTVLDANGAVVTGATDPITLALGPNANNATLTASSLTVVPSNGKAFFTGLTVTQPTAQVIMLAKTSALTVGSTPFDAVAASLAMVQAPDPYQQAASLLTDKSGGALQVAVVDVNNATVTRAAGLVTAVASPNPGGASISGQSASLNGGVAAFPSLQLGGTGAGYGLSFSSNGKSTGSGAFDVAPTTAGGAVFVGASDFSGTNTITRFDAKLLQPYTVNVGYVPKSMVVVLTSAGAFLVVGGHDTFLYVYNTVDLSLVSGPIGLNDTAEVMRQSPASQLVFLAETGASSLQAASLAAYPSISVSDVQNGLINVHGLAVDKTTVSGLLFDLFEIGTGTALVESRPLPVGSPGTAIGPAFPASTSAGYLDVAPTAKVALMTFGSVSVPQGFNPYGATSYSSTFPNPGQPRYDVRFYEDAVNSARALVANDATGQVEIASLVPQASGSPPVMAVDTVADPGNIGNSGAEFITLLINPAGSGQAEALVTDPSTPRLLLIDLTTVGKPTLFSQVPIPAGLTPTAITSHQAGFPNTH